jgi:hypothetical protein
MGKGHSGIYAEALENDVVLALGCNAGREESVLGDIASRIVAILFSILSLDSLIITVV